MTAKQSGVPFNYETITVTQSRINKAILAIPASLAHSFPKMGTSVDIYAGDSPTPTAHKFTPYSRTSKECRISGMRSFYRRFGVRDGDEVVVQRLASGTYRFLPEKVFQDTVTDLEQCFDASESDAHAAAQLARLSAITNTRKDDTALSEYYRLAKSDALTRRQSKVTARFSGEGVPTSLRRLLIDVYGGKCQLTGFGFLMRNGSPYFEVHHIKPELGHHLKNILVVSPNAHAQFHYASVERYVDEEGWLRRVNVSGRVFRVNQAIDKMLPAFEKQVHC